MNKINGHTDSISGILDKLKEGIQVANEQELVDAINENSSYINSLNEDVSELKGQVSALPQPVDYSGDITTLGNAITANSSEIERVREAVDRLAVVIKSLPEIVDYSNAINEITDDIVVQTEKLNSLNDDIVYVNDRVNDVEAKVDSINIVASSSLSALFDKVSPLCSTVLMVFASYGSYEGGIYSGSGSFITLKDSDLSHGLFLTCAHNVITQVDDTVQSIKEAYIENPITREWFRVTPDKVFVDGVGDIALIRTNISFVGSKFKPLKLASIPAKTGDRCIIVGDPAMIDSDSMSSGIVRSARYEMKPIASQINECLHTDAPTIGGNSGSPMMNEKGEIIAMLTYGHEGMSTFGGGPNINSIKKSLSVLSQYRDNKEKKYLGIIWGVVYPTTLFRLKQMNPYLTMTTGGVQIYSISVNSPFYGAARVGDIITSVTTYNSEDNATGTYKIGVHDDEVPLGFLLYEYSVARADVTFISGRSGTTYKKSLRLGTYATISSLQDVPLSTGLKAPLKENPFSG
jgi:S1-C subfamily serine protease